jgi:hypothetical protein
MLDDLIVDLALAMERSGIPYVIMETQSTPLNRHTSLSREMDITLGIGLEKLDLVVNLLGQSGLEFLAEPETFTRETMILPSRDPGTNTRVDFAFSASPYEIMAIHRGKTVRMGRADVRFASPEDLIVHKMITGRPWDLKDARNELLRNPRIDLAYIRLWLGAFSEALGHSLLDQFEETLKGIHCQ